MNPAVVTDRCPSGYSVELIAAGKWRVYRGEQCVAEAHSQREANAAAWEDKYGE